MRGLGRSYGDPAQNGGGTVLRLTGDDTPMILDPDAGTLTVGAGVSLDTILRDIVPRGWFVPVTPGTRFVTVGGCIASDVHGKGHHADRSFGSHVVAMTMLLADGTIQHITPDTHADLWWATIGGMGLTGIIIDATFGLHPDRDRPLPGRHRARSRTSTSCSNAWRTAIISTATRWRGSTWWPRGRRWAGRCCRWATTPAWASCGPTSPRLRSIRSPSIRPCCRVCPSACRTC